MDRLLEGADHRQSMQTLEGTLQHAVRPPLTRTLTSSFSVCLLVFAIVLEPSLTLARGQARLAH